MDDNISSSFYYVDFVATGRFRETDSPGIFTGSYTYRNTGSNTGTLTFNFDDEDRTRPPQSSSESVTKLGSTLWGRGS